MEKNKRAIGMAVVLLLIIPLTVLASGGASGVYKGSENSRKSIFGVASDFGVFAKESITFTSHSDTNFASKLVVSGNNVNVSQCNLQEATSYASTLIQKDGGTYRYQDLSTFVIKNFGLNRDQVVEITDEMFRKDNPIKVTQNNTIQEVIGTSVDVQIEGKTPFIDMDAEFSKLSALSDSLAGNPSTIVYNQNQKEYDYTATQTEGSYVYMNMTKQEYENAGELKVKLPEGKRLIMTVEAYGEKEVSNSPKIMLWNGSSYQVPTGWQEGYDRLILNIHGLGGVFNSSFNISYGTLFAPNYDVKIQNHLGSVICNQLLSNDGEVHYIRAYFPKEDSIEKTPEVPVTEAPTEEVAETPTVAPTEEVAETPTVTPTEEATETPTVVPTEEVAETPTVMPTEEVAETPTVTPTEGATETPTVAPTEEATEAPTVAPTEEATEQPMATPTQEATEVPTMVPTEQPTAAPTEEVTEAPTIAPTEEAIKTPTVVPTEKVTEAPTVAPTEKVTEMPAATPTEGVAQTPEVTPTQAPTETPTAVGPATEGPTTEEPLSTEAATETETPVVSSEAPTAEVPEAQSTDAPQTSTPDTDKVNSSTPEDLPKTGAQSGKAALYSSFGLLLLGTGLLVKKFH